MLEILLEINLSDQRAQIVRTETVFLLTVEGLGTIATAANPEELVKWALFERGVKEVRHAYSIRKWECDQADTKKKPAPASPEK